MYATKAPIDRIILPRSLVARRRVYTCAWQFSLGDVVRYADHLAIVDGRSRSAMGREIYYIQLITGNIAGRAFRYVRAAHLAAAENSYVEESEQIPTLEAV